MKNNFEIRTFHSLRAEGGQVSDPQFTLRGLAAAYNKRSKDLGGFREVIKPGAFKTALDAKDCDIRCLFNHDDSRVLGRQSAGTLKLSETPEGLAFRCQLDPKNTDHRNLWSSVKRGDIDACSFAFNVPADGSGEDWTEGTDEDGKRCTIRSIKSFERVIDVSVVTHPAYDSTSVSARHALDALPVESRSRAKAVFLKTLFGQSKEEKRLAAIAKRNGITVEALRDAENRVNAARLADEIHREQGELKRRLTADEVYELRRRVAAAEPDDDGFGPCADDDDDSEEHERAAERHGNCARRCAERRDAARADLHYVASDMHRLAAQRKSTDPDYADVRFR
ncbi:MAG: HK97 family phage prohead protease, partial [Terriglobales bacterium]